MFEINGKFYAIDMDMVMKWVAESPSNERNISTTTTISYPVMDGDEEIVEKEISENKSSINDVMSNVRYDFVRILLNTLLTASTMDLSVAQRIAFNTLISKNIITEITAIKQ